MADSSQPFPKPPSCTESDGEPDLSVYSTPKGKREEVKKRKKGSETDSPNPGDKQKPKFDEETPPKVQSASVQKVQQAAIVTSSPFLSTNMGSSTDVPIDKPANIKPYRDYLDPNHKLPYEQEKSIQCASVHYTFEKVINDTNIEGKVHVTTYKDLVMRHLREEATIILVRDCIVTELNKKLLESHNQSGIDSMKLDPAYEHAIICGKQAGQGDIHNPSHSHKFKGQEPSNPELKSKFQQEAVDESYEGLSKGLQGKLRDTMENLQYAQEVAADGNKVRRIIIESGNPLLLLVTEVVRTSVRAANASNEREAIMDFASRAMAKEKENSNYLAHEEKRVDNVVTQLGALTCAVAEKFQESDDKKLRIRGLEKVITEPTDYSGTTEAKARARDKREGQFKTWLDELTGRTNFHPTYSFYLIDPKKNDSKQKVTAVLTVALENDKYRLEQIISKDRGGSRDKPSSQRYTGTDPAAFNIPKFTEIAAKIKFMYTNQLITQLQSWKDNNLTPDGDIEALRRKWEIDPDLSLFITRKTAKNPFRIFFEFTDPSSNITLMRFCPGTDPFALFDFSLAIPNPATRDKAKTDANYAKRYKAYKK